MRDVDDGGNGVRGKVQYNLDNGFMDDTQIQRRKPGMRTATIINVLHADDCVLFINTIRAMQRMMVVFDEVSTLFGMELALKKTKVVCNQYSKAIAIAGREIEGHQVPVSVPVASPQHDTRGIRELARMQVNDMQLCVHWESNLPPRGTFLCPGVTFLCPGVTVFRPRGIFLCPGINFLYSY